jgi:two-component system sensor histidine kinase BaeS
LTGRSDEIGDVVRNVNRMAEGLERLEGARRRWLADISHELRTPLTVLRGHVEALQDGVRPLSPEAIDTLHEELLRIGKLVDDLHLLAVSDLKALPCHPGPADAVALLRQLAHRFEPRAAAAGLTLRLCLPEAQQALPVSWDVDRVEQLLGNLVDNSLRYTDPPGEILIGLRAQGSRIQMTVDDSAPGVPAQQLGQVFEPLFRGDLARNRRLGGSGLGLAICQAIAQAHDGHVTASASELGGLRITVELPAQALESPVPEGGRT